MTEINNKPLKHPLFSHGKTIEIIKLAERVFIVANVLVAGRQEIQVTKKEAMRLIEKSDTIAIQKRATVEAIIIAWERTNE